MFVYQWTLKDIEVVGEEMFSVSCNIEYILFLVFFLNPSVI